MQLVLALVAAIQLLMQPADPARKNIRDISIDAMSSETQVSAEPTPGMNLVWYIPTEFWEATVLSEAALDGPEAETFLKRFKGYLFVAIVRADIDDEGKFTFHSKPMVTENLEVSYADAAGARHALTSVDAEGKELKEVIGAIRPILANAMGQMGRNFHFVVFRDTNEKGERLISPYEKGTLSFTLKPISDEIGGVCEVAMPLDCLFEPRLCPKCAKVQRLAWNFCPWDGTNLAKP